MRLLSGLSALLALLVVAAVASAQTERPEGVELVYRDYRDDGVIDACDHPRRALQKTLDQLEPEADIDTPDLRPALEAAIEQVEADECEPEPEPTPEPTATPPVVTPPTVAPAPVTPPPVTVPDSPDSSNVAPLPGGGGGGGGGNDDPPGADEVAPLPEATPAPPAVTPVPPAEPSGPPAEPPTVYDNDDDAIPVPLIVLGGIAVLCALLALLYALLSRMGWADQALSPVRRSWREARFRAGGTWGDFADWMRVGR